jgi:hypothetical protein
MLVSVDARGEHLKRYSKRWLRKRPAGELERMLANTPPDSPAAAQITEALVEVQRKDRRGKRRFWNKLALAVVLVAGCMGLWKFRYLWLP